MTLPFPRLWSPKIGDKIQAKQFVIREASLGTIRNGPSAGRPMVKMQVGRADMVGTLPWTVFDPDPVQMNYLKEGQIVAVTGSIGSYNNKPQLNAEHFWPVKAEHADPNLLYPPPLYDLEELWAELWEKCQQIIKRPDLKRLLQKLFGEEPNEISEIKQRFICWPAARSHHHNTVGGLLKHTLEMIAFAETAVNLYNRVRRGQQDYTIPIFDLEIVVMGIVLHDLMKIVEYGMENGNVTYELEGELYGHLYLGAEMLAKWQEEVQLEQPVYEELKHIILSHHGDANLGHGSVVTPITPNAWLVHYCDMMSSRLMQVWQKVVIDGILGQQFDERGHMPWAVPLDSGKNASLYIGFNPALMALYHEVKQEQEETT